MFSQRAVRTASLLICIRSFTPKKTLIRLRRGIRTMLSLHIAMNYSIPIKVVPPFVKYVYCFSFSLKYAKSSYLRDAFETLHISIFNVITKTKTLTFVSYS